MKIHATWLAMAFWAFACGGAVAQQPPATAVQLPTFSYFSVGTTVSVPDRGSVYMGGVSRASTGRNEFGTPMLPFRPFKNSAIGQERSASQMHVTAYIHDFEAMEEAMLGQPSSYQGLASQQPLPQIAGASHPFLSRDPAYGGGWQRSTLASSAVEPPMSVAEAQARRISEQAARGEEADDFFQRARQAETDGKANVAKIYYQMAARRATGELKEQVLARLDVIGRAETASKIAQSSP
ncbi:MAG TPA: hypothetical protein VMY42_00115 [Thermoguttaceae bacterium]|nr:hypothetical protein [Thermoguttaceae bacterium]